MTNAHKTETADKHGAKLHVCNFCEVVCTRACAVADLLLCFELVRRVFEYYQIVLKLFKSSSLEGPVPRNP